MTRKDLWFYVPALVSALATLRMATLPLALLYGKVPEPETDLLLRVIGTQVLPIAAPSALILLLAWRFYSRRAPLQRWALLLVAAPVVAFAMVFVTLEFGM